MEASPSHTDFRLMHSGALRTIYSDRDPHKGNTYLSLLIYCGFNGKPLRSEVSYVHQSWYKKGMPRSGVSPNLTYHIRNYNSSYIISSIAVHKLEENVKQHDRKADKL